MWTRRATSRPGTSGRKSAGVCEHCFPEFIQNFLKKQKSSFLLMPPSHAVGPLSTVLTVTGEEAAQEVKWWQFLALGSNPWLSRFPVPKFPPWHPAWQGLRKALQKRLTQNPLASP